MTIEEQGGAPPAAITLGLMDAGLAEGVIGTTFQDDLLNFDTVDNVDQMDKAILDARASLESRIGVEAAARLTLVYAGLSDAVATGEVLPGEAEMATEMALAVVAERPGALILSDLRPFSAWVTIRPPGVFGSGTVTPTARAGWTAEVPGRRIGLAVVIG